MTEVLPFENTTFEIPVVTFKNLYVMSYDIKHLPDDFCEPTFLCSLCFNREEEAVVQS